MPEQPKLARVVFDEFHSEAWTIRPDLAKRMQPAHPGDASLAAAADALAQRDFEVALQRHRPAHRAARRHRPPGHPPPLRPQVGGNHQHRLAPLHR